MQTYDVGIIGLGAMGSMTALELARRGRKVVGFDRFRPPHAFGSSTGRSRIIREAYFEHPQYVPLIQRAYELWARLEAASGRRLLIPAGGLMLGAPDGELVSGARRSALEHQLAFEELTAAEIGRRFPGVFVPSEKEVGILEPRAGVLLPELAIESALELAQTAGAELHFDEPLQYWDAGRAIQLRTATTQCEVSTLILSAGAWLPGLLPAVAPALAVARQSLFWFEPTGARERLRPGAMPIFIWEWEPGKMFYGFPDLGEGVKVAIHHQGEPAHPDRVDRSARPGESDRLRDVMAGRLPLCNGPLRDSAVCLYTNTPDGDFIIDRLPGEPRVIVASPCSGHGFKFAPTIGELLADLVEERPPAFDLTPFRLARLIPPGR